jgi:hypothetical protein
MPARRSRPARTVAGPRPSGPGHAQAAAELTAAERAAAPDWVRAYRGRAFAPYGYTADVVGLALDAPSRVLVGLFVERGANTAFAGMDAWPGGFVDEAGDEDARAAALRELDEETGHGALEHLEALQTFDRSGRDPRQWAGYVEGTGAGATWVRTGVRVVSSAFLGLLRQADRDVGPRALPDNDVRRAHWTSVYAYLPWEDLREPSGRAILARVRRDLERWIRASAPAESRRALREQAATLFALETWNEERVEERYALLRRAGLVEEAWRDRWGTVRQDAARTAATYGRALAFDHREMLAVALGRLRGKIKYVPTLLAALLAPAFPLRDLQAAIEGISGRPVVNQNLRRLFFAQGLVEDTEIVEPATPGQRGPRATLARFTADPAARRLDPSLRLPWAPLNAS